MSSSSSSCAPVDFRGVGRGQEQDLAVLVTWGKSCAGSELWYVPGLFKEGNIHCLVHLTLMSLGIQIKSKQNRLI